MTKFDCDNFLSLVEHFKRGHLENTHLLYKEKYRQLVRAIPRLSAPSHHLLGKISAMGTFLSMKHLCLSSKWPTMMEITYALKRRMFP